MNKTNIEVFLKESDQMGKILSKCQITAIGFMLSFYINGIFCITDERQWIIAGFGAFIPLVVSFLITTKGKDGVRNT